MERCKIREIVILISLLRCTIQSSEINSSDHQNAVNWNTPAHPPQIYRLRHMKSSPDIEDTIELLKEGEQEILLKEEYKDLTLVLGMTGAGKSTFTQWIAGNISSLISVEDGGADYIIKDLNDKISNSTIKSKTIFPELVVQNETHYAFYDMPGFSDTRSTAHDISAIYFIKKVIDHAKKIKFAVCVNYPSVKKGVDRQDFMKLVTHMTELIKYIDHYNNSIALIATKVDNNYKKQNGKFTIVKDETIIKGIAMFLEEVRSGLEDKLRNFKLSSNEFQFYENAIKFINILLVKNEEKYTRIGLFRRPDEEGPVEKIALLNEGRAGIRVLLNNLNYSKRQSQDFGYTISYKSKIVVNELIEQINNDIFLCVKIIAEDAKSHYRNLAKIVGITIITLKRDNENISLNSKEAEKFNNLIKRGLNELHKLAEELRSVGNLSELVVTLNKSLNSLEIRITDGVFQNIAVQKKYIDFLTETLGTYKRNSLVSTLVPLFQSLTMYLTRISNILSVEAKKVAKLVESRIRTDIETIADNLKISFIQTEHNNNDISTLYNAMKTSHDKFKRCKNKCDTLPTNKCINEISRFIDIPKSTLVLSKNLEYLYKLYNQSKEFKCTAGLEGLIDYMDKSSRWYSFINRLYDKLTTYEIQKDVSQCKTLAGKVNTNYIGKSILDTDINEVLKRCYEGNYDMELDNIRDIIFDPTKLEKIQAVLSFTLNYTLDIKANCNKVIFTGPFVKITDILDQKNIDDIKIVDVYALEKIFIDADFDKTGEKFQISIIAPIWEIKGNHKITLDGEKGKDFYPSHSADSCGHSGLPGGPGGNILLVGSTFINAPGLTISANGGSGGKAQSGKDGKDGEDGRDPKIEPDNVEDRRLGNCSKIQLGEVCNGVWNGIPFERVSMSEGMWLPFMVSYKFRTEGCKGKDGADGGVGGYGGSPGNVLVHPLSDTKLNIHAEIGDKGTNGEAGKGGLGGRQRVTDLVMRLKVINYENSFSYYFDDTNRAPNGTTGGIRPNYGIINPEPAVPFVGFEEIMDNCRKYLAENFNSVRGSHIRAFYNEMKIKFEV